MVIQQGSLVIFPYKELPGTAEGLPVLIQQGSLVKSPLKELPRSAKGLSVVIYNKKYRR